MRNWIPEQLASQMGLITGISDHVRLFINRKYYGVYFRTYRPGEPLAIANDRLPGTFFKGDSGATMWKSSSLWDLYGEASEEDVAVFDSFLGIFRTHYPLLSEAVEQLNRHLDMEAYAKYSALKVVTGSVHTDASHNHLYFLCSNQGKIEAVPWDCNSFGTHATPDVPVDTVLHPIMRLATCDPRWVHRRNQIIHDMLNTIASPESLSQMNDDAVDAMHPDLKADMYLGSLERTSFGWGHVPFSVLDLEDKRREIKKWIADRHKFLRDFLSNALVHVRPIADQPGWSRVDVAGSVAVRVSWQDQSGRQPKPMLLYPGLGRNLTVFRSNMLLHFGIAYVAPAPLSYALKGNPGEFSFQNALTGEVVIPQDVPFKSPKGGIRTVNPLALPKPATGDIILGPGSVVLNEDLVIGEKQRLIIRPGTQIKLHPGVGIYSQGLTLVQGKPDAWVELEPVGSEPWAALGVYGPQTTGSRFEYLRVSGGSVGSRDGLRFKGMFNVYNCDDVKISHCRFEDNAVGDDAVNLAESKVLVEHCFWGSVPADGLDVDKCTGLIVNCSGTACGNDALDVMASRLKIEQCLFEQSGDKGISVGENSQLLVSNCKLRNNEIGLEIKDSSRVAVLSTLFEANHLGLSSYQKKWAYRRGGDSLLVDCEMILSKAADLSVQKRSVVKLHNTPIEVIEPGSNRVVVVDEIDPLWQHHIAGLQ